MKVVIGKYKSFFGAYQLAEKVFWWAKTKDEYGLPIYPDWVHRLGLKFTGGEDKDGVVQKFFVWLDSKRERKVKVKVDKWDTWDAQTTLAYVILPVLKQFRRELHGAPNTDDEDVPVEIRSTSATFPKNVNEVDEFHFQRWEYIIDQMIWSFEQILDDQAECQFHSGTPDIVLTPIDKDGNEVEEDKGFRFRVDKGPNDTSSFDKEGYLAWKAKVDNGLRLFGKYYQNLWN